ncbi:MAG TPA: hypothetical protein VKV74_08405 [Bryobacteraceae bacterium]|nr:hypothetical protein [Bryobacteraceae bacterium]
MAGGIWEDALLAVLILLYVSPLFWILVPATQDGPSHLSIANVLLHLLSHDRPVLAKYFEINWFPEPNLLGYLILIPLLRLVNPFAAEKILFGAFVVSLPLAARFCLRSVNRQAPSWLAFLVVPFTWAKMMQAGFYNFCLSLAVFLVCLGYFLRAFPCLNAPRAAALGLLTLLLYFSHAMSMGMFWLSLLVLIPWLAWAEHRCGAGTDGARRLRLLMAAVAPAGALFAGFLLRNRGAHRAYGVSLQERVFRLAGLSSLVTHRRVEMIFSTGALLLFAVLVAAFAVRRAGSVRFEAGDVFLALAALFLIVLFLIPDSLSGGSAHSQRAELYPFLVIPLWFAAQPRLGGWTELGMAIAAAALAIGLWVLNVSQIRKIDQAIREYYTVTEHIKPDRTVLPVTLAPHGRDARGEPLSIRSEMFVFAASRLNALAGAIELYNYQAMMPGFAVRYRGNWAHWSQTPPDQVWNRIGEDLCSGPIWGDPDYVLLYGWDRARNDADPEALRALERRYALEFVSSPTQAVRLYRRATP